MDRCAKWGLPPAILLLASATGAAYAQTVLDGLGSQAVAAAEQSPGTILPTDFIITYRGPTGRAIVSPAVGMGGGGGGGSGGPPYQFTSSGPGQFALAIGTNTQLTVPAGTLCAQITLESGAVRRTSDGATSATTTIGTLIPQGSSWQDCGPLAAYKLTTASGSPTLDVEYFK